jgi:pyruvate dehydrogenase E2 component (dihydrolipoamide acetyltransferase)
MDILMPQLGETVTEGKITTWFKSIGDAVKAGDNLFEIETDKVAMEVPATAAGVLAEIRVGAGEAAPVGAVVAVLAGALSHPPPLAGRAIASEHPPAHAGEGGGAAPLSPPPGPLTRADLPPPGGGFRQAAAVPPPAAPPRVMLDPFREVRTPERNYGPARLASGAVATPLARRLAGEAGIDLARIEPSGPHGRITGRDVQVVINNVSALYDAFGRRRPQRHLPSPDPDSIRVFYQPESYEETSLDDAQRANAARLIAAANIPHLRMTADIVVERLEAVREEANAAAMPDQSGKPVFRLSLDDFIVRAFALALRRVPAANAVWAEDRILRFKRSDIGVAVTTADGLVMPVIRGADKKPLLGISAELADLAARARAGKLEPAELKGGASAICNLGPFGVRTFDAIVNPPHATLLAVGAPVRRPIESEDGIRFVTTITVTLCCDQRVIGPMLGAELLGAVRHFIEHPVGLMI